MWDCNRFLGGFLLRMSGAVVGLIWLCAAWVACGQQETESGEEARAMPPKTIEVVLQEHTDALMAIPGVVGTAQGLCSGQPCIKVFVVKKTPALLRQIPSAIEGYEVAVEETGAFRALDPG